MTEASNKWKPELGYVLVRRAEPGTTAAGLVIPNTKGSEYHWYVVEASRGYISGGQLVECTLRPGEELVIEEHQLKAHNPHTGDIAVRSMIRTRRVDGMPDDHYFVKLLDVIGRRADVGSN